MIDYKSHMSLRMERTSFFSNQAGRKIDAPKHAKSRFCIGDVVRHKMFDFRGVIFDIDPVFANSEDWYSAIPEEIRPSREQPFYHLLAENEEGSYVAYVSQQNLIADGDGGPVSHPQIASIFEDFDGARYWMRRSLSH
jgi:heat shock protein HspQ